jgi:phage terminase large subunit-like protein
MNNVGVIAIVPEVDKITRYAAISAQFEGGCVFFPKTAPWLDCLKAELLGFPNVKYDDQVDSVAQALNWIARHRQAQTRWVGPIVVTRPRKYFGDPPENWWMGP